MINLSKYTIVALATFFLAGCSEEKEQVEPTNINVAEVQRQIEQLKDQVRYINTQEIVENRTENKEDEEIRAAITHLLSVSTLKEVENWSNSVTGSMFKKVKTYFYLRVVPWEDRNEELQSKLQDLVKNKKNLNYKIIAEEDELDMLNYQIRSFHNYSKRDLKKLLDKIDRTKASIKEKEVLVEKIESEFKAINAILTDNINNCPSPREFGVHKALSSISK